MMWTVFVGVGLAGLGYVLSRARRWVWFGLYFVVLLTGAGLVMFVWDLFPDEPWLLDGAVTAFVAAGLLLGLIRARERRDSQPSS
jgi:hypothetical protein